MSDDKPKAEKVPYGYVNAEGTLSGTDDAQIYVDIAETLLNLSSYPLDVVMVQRWPRDGHVIVWVRADQDAGGTRAKKALATQIEEWEAAVEEPAT